MNVVNDLSTETCGAIYAVCIRIHAIFASSVSFCCVLLLLKSAVLLNGTIEPILKKRRSIHRFDFNWIDRYGYVLHSSQSAL